MITFERPLLEFQNFEQKCLNGIQKGGEGIIKTIGSRRRQYLKKKKFTAEIIVSRFY